MGRLLEDDARRFRKQGPPALPLILWLFASISACAVPDVSGKLACNTQADCLDGFFCFDRQCAWATPPPVATAAGFRWSLILAEEFDGNDYNHDRLSPCFDWNVGDCTSSFNQGREHYQPSQITVGDGTAKLVAAPLAPPFANHACFEGSCNYKSGLLSTCRPNADDGSPYLFTFAYGYLESRLKVPGTQGFFSALTVLPADPSFVYPFELDVVAISGENPRRFGMSYLVGGLVGFSPSGAKGENGRCDAVDASSDFHVFAVDWAVDHIAFFVDRVECGRVSGGEIPALPAQIVFNLAVDIQTQREAGKPLLDSGLSAELEVDYLRVWQQIVDR